MNQSTSTVVLLFWFYVKLTRCVKLTRIILKLHCVSLWPIGNFFYQLLPLIEVNLIFNSVVLLRSVWNLMRSLSDFIRSKHHVPTVGRSKISIPNSKAHPYKIWKYTRNLDCAWFSPILFGVGVPLWRVQRGGEFLFLIIHSFLFYFLARIWLEEGLPSLMTKK